MLQSKRLSELELREMVGGLDLTGSLLSAMSKSVSTLYNLGRALGSSIRRIRDGAFCEI